MTHATIEHLREAGISSEDAHALRRIAMTLHRWHELECGSGNDHASWCITRGRKVGKLFEHDEKGFAYQEVHSHYSNKPEYTRIPDREGGALKRMAKIMVRYPGMSAYVQSDCRGAPLYILRPGDVPDGGNVASYYSHGIAVYK